MKNLLLHEFTVQNKVGNLARYSLLFFSFCLIIAAVVNSPDEIKRFGSLFSVIYIPIAFLGLADRIFKPCLINGELEFYLTITSGNRIVSAKFVALSLISSICFLLVTPLILIFFDLNLEVMIRIVTSALLLILLCSSLIILIAAIQSYFRNNANYLVITILPIIIPSIMLCGMLIQSEQNLYILYLLAGIDLIFIPVTLIFASYLIDNIYNI